MTDFSPAHYKLIKLYGLDLGHGYADTDKFFITYDYATFRTGTRQKNSWGLPLYPNGGKYNIIGYPMHNGITVPSYHGVDKVKHLGNPAKGMTLCAGFENMQEIISISGEWDIPSIGRALTDNHIDWMVNEQILAIVESYATLHWRLSGNKSIYFDLFLNEPIPRLVAMRLKPLLSELLIMPTEADHFDAYSPEKRVRLPLSYHHESKTFCNFYQCQTIDDTEDYILDIEPDHLSAENQMNLIHELENYLGIASDSDNTDYTSSPSRATSVPSGGHPDSTPLYSVHKYSMIDYEAFYEQGIPRGIAFDVMRGFGFLNYIYSQTKVTGERFGDKCREIVTLNVDDKRVREERLDRLEASLRKFCPFRWRDVYPWRDRALKALKSRVPVVKGNDKTQRNLIAVAKYCLNKLAVSPEGADIGLKFIMNDVFQDQDQRMSINTASKYRKLLQTEYPIMVKIRDHFKGKYVERFVLNQEYVEALLGYPINLVELHELALSPATEDTAPTAIELTGTESASGSTPCREESPICCTSLCPEVIQLE